MAKLVINTAAVEEPVTVAELMTHARIDSMDEAELLGQLLRDAREAAEGFCWAKFLQQTWDEYFDSFASPLVLTHQPVSSLTHVKYTDTGGTEQTLGTSVYELGEVNGKGVVRLKYDQTWPSGVRGHPDVVVVRYLCGYGDERHEVPHNVRAAIKIHAAHCYEFRELEKPIPDAFYRLLRPYSFREF